MSTESRSQKRHTQHDSRGFGSSSAAPPVDEEYAYEVEPDPDGNSASVNAEAEDAHSACDAICCTPLEALRKPVEVGELGSASYAGEAAFWVWPLFGPLLFENTGSDARDGLANERTFLSYLRLAMTMAVMAMAIMVSFHLKRQPSALELRMALPLGIIFWLLSILTLVVGAANYIKTVNKYSRRMAIVQTGWKTQSIMATVAIAIFGACAGLLVINRLSENDPIQ